MSILRAMQITVFGAGGKVGRQVVALALDKGYTVTAFTHSHSPFQDQTRLRIVSGDINSQQDVIEALQGSQAVISSLGSWHTKQKNILERAMLTIIPAMQDQGINRVISLTGSAAFWSQDRPKLIDKLNHRLLSLLAPKILSDGEAHLALLAASKLDWTCVRSPIMTSRGGVKYILRNQLSVFGLISRQAVAQCLVDQIEATDFLQHAPVIYKH
jgi:putative NADH-flavin reductase